MGTNYKSLIVYKVGHLVLYDIQSYQVRHLYSFSPYPYMGHYVCVIEYFQYRITGSVNAMQSAPFIASSQAFSELCAYLNFIGIKH